MANDILEKLNNGELTVQKAYKKLYGKRTRPIHLKKAHFVKLRIIIPDEKGVTRFLAFLFLCPLPLFIARWAMKYAKGDWESETGMSKNEILEMISAPGIRINVNTNSGEKIIIKTF